MGLTARVQQRVFDALYQRNLIYNTCWEDPACDRKALGLGPDDTVLVITSAGCNALDYALCAPKAVHAVDANPRQNALLELKLAGLRELQFDDFFSIFGEGRHAHFKELYRSSLRGHLTPFARRWWDSRDGWFAGNGWRNSLYYRGLSGLVARSVRTYVDRKKGLRPAIEALLDARSLDEQRDLYDTRVAPLLWTKSMRWAISRQTTMSLLGVPGEQTKEVARAHDGGVAGFITTSIGRVFRDLPIWTNYFWSVYLRGSYTRECCPEYLKEANFLALQGGLVDRVHLHTTTVTEALRGLDAPISRYVLLDHMDWMGSRLPEALNEEWTWLFERAAPGARAIFRSAHANPTFLSEARFLAGGRVVDRLRFQDRLAADLHLQDRVGTYGGFHIADLVAA